MESKEHISISVKGSDGSEIELNIYAETDQSLFILDETETYDDGESCFQLREGRNYQYELPEGYSLEESAIIRALRKKKNRGRICPNIYVGSFPIQIYKDGNIPFGKVTLEICSVKLDYRRDYRRMLEDITSKCIDLLMLQSSIVNQHFTIDPLCDSKTLYQRYAFIRSVVDSESFGDAIHKISTSPVKKWKEAEISRDICNLKRINHRTIKQIVTKYNRTSLPTSHSLKSIVNSVPDKVDVPYKVETVDIPENRFIKYALESFLQFCTSISCHSKASNRLKQEALHTCEHLEIHLSSSIFKEISNLTILPLNSPILQRKEGYREILQAWYMFDLAARLIWKGGDNVYDAGKRDVATLYEYWVFFTLLDLIENVFRIPSTSLLKLIVPTKDGLGLQLKKGIPIVIESIYETEQRKINIEFCYNKSFSYGQQYPIEGSWTKEMRPDYTLSIWPNGIEKEEAENQELIAHIHFDAKYKIEGIESIFKDDNVDEEKIIDTSYYKRSDLLKMHAYKDAIRRSVGAYILYPGNHEEKFYPFHEILPGVGAFIISPSKINKGIDALRNFLFDVVNHFLDRASQREKIAYHTYATFKEENRFSVHENLPEPYRNNRDLIPDETYVLVAYYKDKEHLEWIHENRRYNSRTETNRGSLPLNNETTSSKYLLLHGENETISNRIYKLDNKGPRIYSKEKLKKMNYPGEPSLPYYIVFSILDAEPEIKGRDWDITKLKDYKSRRNSAIPFTVTLTELMQTVV